MKKYYFLIIVALIFALVLTGCSLLSNVGQVPATEQSGITYLTKTVGPPLYLVGLWRFDETSGTTAVDSSGVIPPNDGTLYNFESPHGWVPGTFGNALSFDGVNDYVDCGAAVDNSITTGITLEAWIMPALRQNGGIISNDLTYSSKKGYDFFLWSAGGSYGRLYIDFGNGSALGRIWWDIPSSDWYNQWHHVAATWDGSVIKLYADESKVAEVGYIGTYSDPGKNTFIGAINYSTPAYCYFNRLIDEVRIWRSVLNAYQLNDMTAPTITITTPAHGATYILNQTVNADWSTSDGAGTGVASETGTVLSGSPIDTGTVGTKTFEVTATDYAKNMDTKTVTYKVAYGFLGLLPPYEAPPKAFKIGSSIPLKWHYTNSAGTVVDSSAANPNVSIVFVTGPPGGETETPIDVNDPGNSGLRYDDSITKMWIFNWQTKGLKAGIYNIRITSLQTGQTNLFPIQLR